MEGVGGLRSETAVYIAMPLDNAGDDKSIPLIDQDQDVIAEGDRPDALAQRRARSSEFKRLTCEAPAFVHDQTSEPRCARLIS